VYFEQPQRSFEYHNAPEKTQSATHPIHDNWTSLGDVGYVDEEGYLYLTDRKAYMIISGGVNIYPQEIEDALVLHDAIQDVAVFGVPNADFGEEVKAVVELAPGQEPSDALAGDPLTSPTPYRDCLPANCISACSKTSTGPRRTDPGRVEITQV
jgi:long-chain acyl-CoA synthetase